MFIKGLSDGLRVILCQMVSFFLLGSLFKNVFLMRFLRVFILYQVLVLARFAKDGQDENFVEFINVRDCR